MSTTHFSLVILSSSNAMGLQGLCARGPAKSTVVNVEVFVLPRRTAEHRRGVGLGIARDAKAKDVKVRPTRAGNFPAGPQHVLTNIDLCRLTSDE